MYDRTLLKTASYAYDATGAFSGVTRAELSPQHCWESFGRGARSS